MFIAHLLNLRSGPSEMPLAEFSEAGTVWTKLFGVLSLLPNSIAITLREDTVHCFVVTGRGTWVSAITRAREGGASVR